LPAQKTLLLQSWSFTRGRVGERPPHSNFFLLFLLLLDRFGASGLRTRPTSGYAFTALFCWFYGCSAGSPLAWRHTVLTTLSTSPAETRLVPARQISKLWDCKVTPAYCACQEGNTIGCISSNDGLDAGMRDWFSTTGIHRAFIKGGGGLRTGCRG